MSTRVLASFLAIAIAWVSLFSLEVGHQDVQGSTDHASIFNQPIPERGSVVDHHLDDVPLQFVDSAVDLPDHQPICYRTTPPAPSLAVPPTGTTASWTAVFLDGLLRPPISSTRLA